MNDLNDILGRVLIDYQNDKLINSPKVCFEGFDDDEMDVSFYFRKPEEMPEIEKVAIDSLYGKVLEIKAGAGSHTLYIQDKGMDVKAIDVSKGAVEVMIKRGVISTELIDVRNIKNEKYDSILSLNNGIGLAGDLTNLAAFINHIMSLLNPNGQFIFDSTDLRYLFEDEDGSFLLDLNAQYYGEMTLKYNYKGQDSETFKCLYIDKILLSEIVNSLGYKIKFLYDDNDYHYLARITS